MSSHLIPRKQCDLCSQYLYNEEYIKDHKCEFLCCTSCAKKNEFQRIPCKDCVSEIQCFQAKHSLVCTSCSKTKPIASCSSSHSYCEGCLKHLISIRSKCNFQKCCEELIDSITYKYKCNLCPNFLDESSLRCPSGHGYCNNCISNLHNSEKTQFPQCCMIHFASEYEIMNLPQNNETLWCRLCENPTITQKSACENDTNYCEDCLNTVDPSILLEQCQCTFCNTLATTIYELRKESIPDDPNLTYQEERKENNKRQSTQCRICNAIFPPEVTSCVNNFYYCEPCVNRNLNIINVKVCQCDYCRKIADWIENRRAGERDSIKRELIQKLRSKEFNPPCHVCKSASDLAFGCDHNLCFKCIAKKCFSVFYNFILCYCDRKPENIPRKAEFLCPATKCGKNIRVPAGLLLGMYKKKLQQSDLDTLAVFTPYFDGIRARFRICMCNNVVADAGDTLINCICRRAN